MSESQEQRRAEEEVMRKHHLEKTFGHFKGAVSALQSEAMLWFDELEWLAASLPRSVQVRDRSGGGHARVARLHARPARSPRSGTSYTVCIIMPECRGGDLARVASRHTRILVSDPHAPPAEH